MREDCRHFESRTYANGETMRKCALDLAPDAPWRCPADCPRYEPRPTAGWTFGSLGGSQTAPEPPGLDDGSAAAVLDEAEDIVNAVSVEVLAEAEAAAVAEAQARTPARLGREGVRALPLAKARYLREGMGQVEGWLNPSTAVYLASLEVLQRDAGPEGDVCEIGIHHGKSFLCLAAGLPAGDRAVAVDLFANQAENVDGSGMGSRRRFERHLDRWGDPSRVDVIAASSLELEPTGFLSRERGFRLFSVDGGHTAATTLNDLRVAEATTVPGGLVVLDDVLNPHWLGVISGLFEYWAGGGGLLAVVYVPNKLLLSTDADSVKRYQAMMWASFAAASTKRGVAFGPATIDVYGHHPWSVTDEQGTVSPPLETPVARAALLPRWAKRLDRTALAPAVNVARRVRRAIRRRL